jgi:putative ABC transport system substrate-binding protein
MQLIGLAVIFALILFLLPAPSEAQQAGKMYRVGILSVGYDPSSVPQYYEPFRQSLADSGYVEGRNVSFAYRWARGDPNRLPALAIELVRLGVDVLFAVSMPTNRALAEATTTIPIVVISAGDPIDAGLVASLARPGGNITGVSSRVMELNEKLLELLKETMPSASSPDYS